MIDLKTAASLAERLLDSPTSEELRLASTALLLFAIEVAGHRATSAAARGKAVLDRMDAIEKALIEKAEKKGRRR